MTHEHRKILESAVDHYGAHAQTVKALEELMELHHALSRGMIGDMTREDWNHIAEEIADVEIMTWQLKHILQNRAAVAEWRERKIQRLHDRLEANP